MRHRAEHSRWYVVTRVLVGALITFCGEYEDFRFPPSPENVKVDQIIESLKNNAPSMKSLSLPKLPPADYQAIAEALKVNTTLRSLEINYVSVGDAEAKALAEALKVNATLEELLLISNAIGMDGFEALEEALKTNHTLQHLNLSHNYASEEKLDERTARKAIEKRIQASIERNRQLCGKMHLNRKASR